VVAGDVVIVDTTNDGAFTTTTSGQSQKSVGVAQETIANNGTGRVLVAGYAALVNVPASVTRGHYIETHTVAKQATGNSTRRAGSFGQFLTGGTTPTAWLWGFPDNAGATGETVATSTIWDAKGDLAAGTGADAGAKLTVGSNGKLLSANSAQSTGLEWIDPTDGVIGTFTPTWTGSGSNPSLGDGTLTGHYQKISSKLYWFSIMLVYGTTSTAGTGFYIFGNLPFTVKSTTPVEQIVAANVRDSGTTRFACTAVLNAGSTSVNQVTVGDATGARQFSGTVPITLTSGDSCSITGIVATD